MNVPGDKLLEPVITMVCTVTVHWLYGSVLFCTVIVLCQYVPGDKLLEPVITMVCTVTVHFACTNMHKIWQVKKKKLIPANAHSHSQVVSVLLV